MEARLGYTWIWEISIEAVCRTIAEVINIRRYLLTLRLKGGFVQYLNKILSHFRFLDYLSAFPEVYVVSVSQLLEWVENPVPIDRLDELESFHCTDLPQSSCPSANVRNCQYKQPLPIESQEVYMNICQGPCPYNYPYLDNVDGSIPYPEE